MEVGEVHGVRKRIIPIIGGHVTGDRLSGVVESGGADWQTLDADGTATIDTRYWVRTHDGVLVAFATQGFRHGPAEVLARLAAGEPVSPMEYSFRLTARLESGDPRYAWVNTSLFLAVAAREFSRVVYDLYEFT